MPGEPAASNVDVAVPGGPAGEGASPPEAATDDHDMEDAAALEDFVGSAAFRALEAPAAAAVRKEYAATLQRQRGKLVRTAGKHPAAGKSS